MALKEGRCYNCGSILMLDPQREKGHCLYCDAVFDNKLAFKIAEHPENYEFKNEKMEAYTGPNLDPVDQTPGVADSDYQAALKHNAAKKALADSSKAGKPQLSQEGTVPELKAPKRSLWITVVVLLTIAAVFLAITLPLTKNRDEVREELTANFLEAEDLNLSYGIDFLLRGSQNTTLVMVLPEKPTESEVKSYGETFAVERARLMELPKEDMYRDLDMEVLSEEGGYLITWSDQNEILLKEVD